MTKETDPFYSYVEAMIGKPIDEIDGVLIQHLWHLFMDQPVKSEKEE